jgi:hypothetical protein
MVRVPRFWAATRRSFAPPFTVTHEYIGTGCVRALEEPKRLSNQKIDMAIPQCRRSSAECNLCNFFSDNKDSFLAIKEAIRKLGDDASDELQTASKLIEDAEKNPESICDSRVCRKLGDILIAIDGAKLACFAANNDKEWVLLSKVLGKRLINPVNLRAKR